MGPPVENEPILLTRDVRSASSVSEHPTGLPLDLLVQSISRLRILAWLYAGVFFMVGFFPAFLFPLDRAHLFSSVLLWAPGAVSIAAALLVVAVIRSASVPLWVKLNVGLVFEVAASYGIAAAEFLEPSPVGGDLHWMGLSWVAVWTVLFTVVVPTRPRRALVAAAASACAVPVVVGLAMATG
jgi:hypothetical protein